ncbi:MAG: CHAT domain-containing protein [Acidobacteriota bacterium]
MRYILPLLILFSSFIPLFPSKLNSNDFKAEDQEKLMNVIIEFTPDKNPEILKQKLLLLSRCSMEFKNTRKTSEFFKKILRKKRFKHVYYYIYLQLAKISEKNRKNHLKKALESSGNDGERLESLIKLYEFHRRNGDINREILYLEEQAGIRKKHGDNISLKQIFITLGDYHMHENNLLKSIQSFFEAEKYSKKIQGSSSGYIYNKIAKAFFLLGKNKLTLKFLGKSLACAKKHKNDHLRMWVFNIYTELFLSEEDYFNADNFNRKSIKIGEEKNFPELILNAYFLRAKLFFYNNQEITGLTILKTAADFGINNESYDHLMPVLYEFIKRAIRYDNLEIATSYLKKISEIYTPFYRGYFFYYFLKALLNEKMGKQKDAGEYYNKTLRNLNYFFSELNHLRHYPFRKEISFIYSRIARYNFRMFDDTNNLKYLRTAFYAGEVRNPYMFRRISDGNRRVSSIKREKAGIESKIAESEEKLYSGMISGSRLNSYRKKVNSLKTELLELEDLILEFPKRYRRFHISDLNLPEIHKSLNRDTVVIRFIVLEEHTYAFVIDYKSAGYKKLEMGSKYIKNLVDSLLSPIHRYENGEVDFLRIKYDMGISEELYKILLHDILEFHKEKQKLIIIPDESLFKIPFEALITESGGRHRQKNVIFSEYEDAGFLIDRYSVEYLLSIFHLKKKRNNGRKKYEISAFGFPITDHNNKWLADFSDHGNSVFTQLPSSLEEIKKIKNIWGERRARFYTGKEFTKENFNKTAKVSSIIHMATHFVSNRKYPWYSSFLFSPGQKNNPLYFVSDISKLKLNCDLIFLSSCGSLENHLMGKQLISGMTATLYNSGAESMIASLWPVNEFSSKIIVPFYSALKKKNRGVKDLADILRLVKMSFRKKNVELRDGNKISFAHPLIWANFNLYKFFIRK